MRKVSLGHLSVLALTLAGCGGGGGGGTTPPPVTTVPEALRGTRFIRYQGEAARGTAQITVQANGQYTGLVTRVAIPTTNAAPEVLEVNAAGTLARQADNSYRGTGSGTTPAGPVSYIVTLTPRASGEPTLAISVTRAGVTTNAGDTSIKASAIIPEAIRGRVTGRLISESTPDAPVDVNIITTRLGDFGGSLAFPLGESTTVDSFYGRLEPDGSYTGRSVTEADGSFGAQGSINPANLVMSYSDPDAPEFVAVGTVSVAK